MPVYEGNRIRVSLVVTDRENAEIIELLQPFGIETVFMSRERLRDDASELLALLKERGVELIALDDFKGILPESVESEYAGKVVTLTGPEVGTTHTGRTHTGTTRIPTG